MAEVYKTLSAQNDITETKVDLHETIPVTGSLVSGTYGTTSDVRGENIKVYNHGMFQSVYDYPYLSSSANYIFDLTNGVTTGGRYSLPLASGAAADGDGGVGSSKTNVRNQMALSLVGVDHTGSIKDFRVSGSETGDIIQDPLFINFSRLMYKDEIKKGSFRLTLGMEEDYDNPFSTLFYIGDYGASQSFDDTNSPAGEFGILRSGSSTDPDGVNLGNAVGLVYYQAGVAVLDMSATIGYAAAVPDTFEFVRSTNTSPADLTYTGSIESGTMDEISDALRHRIYNIQFDNTTELQSTIYFCRANNREFNYSSNPTYVSGSEIIIKEGDANTNPASYITTVGLYSDANELLAVAKLSEPLKKTPDNELTFRVRLDY